jgi:Arc/MetJ family transcription regulator
MRTTLDIDETLLNEAVERSGARTRTEVVEDALTRYVRALRRESLKKRILGGDLGIDLTDEQFEKLRGRA